MPNKLVPIESINEASEPVEFITKTGMNTEELQDIINKLKTVINTKDEYFAISAPQIGINKRIICLKFTSGVKTFINPIVTKKQNYQIGVETCANMPNKEILVLRPTDITLVYYNDTFKYEENKLTGVAARFFEQAYQFLDGITPEALGMIADITRDGKLEDQSEDDKKAIFDIYKKYITIKTSSAKKEIELNDELKKEYNSLKFTENVINGRTKVVESDEEFNTRQNAKKIAEQSIDANLKAGVQYKKAKFKEYASNVSKKRKKR